MESKINIKSLCLDPICSECNNPATKIEIIEPNGYPRTVDDWTKDELVGPSLVT